MEKQVVFTERGIQIGETEIPLYSGAVHYWRMDREIWDLTLDNIKKMGFQIIETYIPWCVHEPEKGEFDFGEKDSRKDLGAFLNLCEEKELFVIVRPGPHINAELTLFGYPQWLLEQEEIWARSPQGTSVVYPYISKPFPIPSYTSSKLYLETEQYFEQLKPILRKHCYPAGGIILIQVDNETCNFFRDYPYILDYSEESAGLFYHMLEEKYEHIEKLNQVYQTCYKEWREVPLPKGYREGDRILEPYYDWVEYKEYQILDALRRMLGILKKMDLPIPVFHNCAYQEYTPISVQRDEKIPGLSVAGMDAYPDPEDVSMLKERIRYLAGSSRLPFVPEFGSGSWFDRGLLLTPSQEEFGYLYSFMNGLKAINFYMLADRDRWTGCPIQNNGSIRYGYYEMFQSLLSFLKKEEVYQYQRQPKVLLMKNYEMGRLKALLSVKDRNTFSSNCFIQGTDIPRELFVSEEMPDCMTDTDTKHYGKETWILEMMDVLDQQHVEYDISDQYLSMEKLKKYDWIIASSYDFMEPEVQGKLAAYAAMNGKQLCIGPVMPQKDRRGNVCTVLKEAQSIQEIIVLEHPDQIKELASLPAGEYRCTAFQVELSVHEKSGSDQQLLYMANISSEEKQVVLQFSGKRFFEGIWRAENTGGEGFVRMRIRPWEVAVWKVKKEDKQYAG